MASRGRTAPLTWRTVLARPSFCHKLHPVTVTPRRPPQLRNEGDHGPAAPRKGGGRRLPSPAENKVSSAPALTPGAICSGTAGFRGCRRSRPPWGSCHPAATHLRLCPGTPSSPVAPSPPFPGGRRQLPRERGHRWLRRTGSPFGRTTPTPNPTPRPDPKPTLGVRDGGARRGEQHNPERTDGAPHRAAPRGGTAATGSRERTPARAPRRGALPVPVRICGFKSGRSGAMCSAPNKSNNKGGRRTPPPPPGAGAVGGPGAGPRPRPAPAPPGPHLLLLPGLLPGPGDPPAPPGSALRISPGHKTPPRGGPRGPGASEPTWAQVIEGQSKALAQDGEKGQLSEEFHHSPSRPLSHAGACPELAQFTGSGETANGTPRGAKWDEDTASQKPLTEAKQPGSAEAPDSHPAGVAGDPKGLRPGQARRAPMGSSAPAPSPLPPCPRGAPPAAGAPPTALRLHRAWLRFAAASPSPNAPAAATSARAGHPPPPRTGPGRARPPRRTGPRSLLRPPHRAPQPCIRPIALGPARRPPRPAAPRLPSPFPQPRALPAASPWCPGPAPHSPGLRPPPRPVPSGGAPPALGAVPRRCPPLSPLAWRGGRARRAPCPSRCRCQSRCRSRSGLSPASWRPRARPPMEPAAPRCPPSPRSTASPPPPRRADGRARRLLP
ncbi:basic proline-rich protein-like [Vidua chalybeata]|uniref:basic proline-rich protein-like n=1 Tax=Vidua chalybeata TaxID=81927 RepID=UPI0023A8611F|nr:basic proline-rich protein-like [Vidua chalybeata]